MNRLPCSAIPIFIGFISAGVPLGITFSFLISAPMVNEIAIILLYGIAGWKITALYMVLGLLIATFSGWIIAKFHLEKYIEEWIFDESSKICCIYKCKINWNERIAFSWTTVREIFKQIWIYIVIGIMIGACINSYIPEGFLSEVMGKGAWWTVPSAIALGVPMYSNAAGIIPIVGALIDKGASLGTVLAFMMSVIALSLPAIIALRKILKPQLIAVFLVVVVIGILFVGYIFNLTL